MTNSTEWQLIETAPKDRNIMLYGPCPEGPRVTEGYWLVLEHGKYLGDCGGECRCPEYGEAPEPFWMSEDGGFTKEWPPTHWCEKPKPPTVGEKGDAK